MAHRIDFSKGFAAIFSVRETPWHSLGTILETAPSLNEALRLGGLDFDVTKLPTFRPIYNGQGTEPSDFIKNEQAFVTVRTDTGAELGAVGPDYQPLQNRDAFRSLEPLIDQGVLKLETGGALRGGRDVWVLGRFDTEKFGPVVREVFADEVIPYALVRNNHAGTRNASVSLTPIRVVCANTLGAADNRAERGLDKAIGVRHVGDVEARMVEAARDLFAGIIERYEVLATQYRALKGFYLDEALFRSLVLDIAAPRPQDNPRFNPDASTAELVIARAEAKRDAIATAWTNGQGHSGDHSAWEAYNGLVEVIDHNTDLFPTRNGAYRTASLLDGKLGQIKRDVLAGLVAEAA